MLCHQDQPCTDTELNPSILLEQCVSSEAAGTELIVRWLILTIRLKSDTVHNKPHWNQVDSTIKPWNTGLNIREKGEKWRKWKTFQRQFKGRGSSDGIIINYDCFSVWIITGCVGLAFHVLWSLWKASRPAGCPIVGCCCWVVWPVGSAGLPAAFHHSGAWLVVWNIRFVHLETAF